jgi:hypothetical protein
LIDYHFFHYAEDAADIATPLITPPPTFYFRAPFSMPIRFSLRPLLILLYPLLID